MDATISQADLSEQPTDLFDTDLQRAQGKWQEEREAEEEWHRTLATDASVVTSSKLAEQLWNDPVRAFESLRDLVCEAMNITVAIHREALRAEQGESLANVRRDLHEPLLHAIREAQAIWFHTPIARYLDRLEGQVFLDQQGGRLGVTGSCYHDLLMGVAVGLWRWIQESLPAVDYVKAMRRYTAAGDYAHQHLASLVSLVRCECQQGVARWNKHSSPKKSPAPNKEPVPAPAGRDLNVFALDGDYWTLAFGGQKSRLKDRVGLRYLTYCTLYPSRILFSCALRAYARE